MFVLYRFFNLYLFIIFLLSKVIKKNYFFSYFVFFSLSFFFFFFQHSHCLFTLFFISFFLYFIFSLFYFFFPSFFFISLFILIFIFFTVSFLHKLMARQTPETSYIPQFHLFRPLQLGPAMPRTLNQLIPLCILSQRKKLHPDNFFPRTTNL